MKKKPGSNNKVAKNAGVPTAILKCIHLFAVVHFVYGIYYDFTFVHFPKTTNMSNNFGGKFKYLTVLDAVSFTFVSFFSCISMIDSVKDQSSKTDLQNLNLRTYKNIFLSVILKPKLPNLTCLIDLFQFLQAIYFTVALTNDFIGTNEANPRKIPAIRKVKDYMFSSLAFPIAFNVGISFWGLYAVDRELVFPKVLDAVFPV